MIKKLLIANRGEVALRIIRACKELGIQTVAIYSQADTDSLHVSLADEAYCVGPHPSEKSYLNIPSIMSVALTTGADAIHPGYGFLAERTDFAEICKDHNITFIGPQPEAMRLIGDKANARKLMKESNISITEGTDLLESYDEADRAAKTIGYPVIIKATAGGGGKGMRIAYSESELAEMFDICRTEAQNAFGNPAVYMEKYVENPRHIEIQIMADKFGNVCYFPERDCSIQRRHQKLLEESPSANISETMRKAMGETAVNVVKAIKYEGAGTVEFLVDKNNNFYFMEMNARLQVEHGVSEMVTGIDIVQEQIKIAAGLPLSFSQKDVKINGHAIECRINAENPDKDFMPNPGEIQGYITPGGFGVRIDSHVYTGYKIPPYYDSMISKVISWGKDRDAAIKRMLRALSEYLILGVKTTVDFQKEILNDKQFQQGSFDTSFIEKFIAKINSSKQE